MQEIWIFVFFKPWNILKSDNKIILEILEQNSIKFSFSDMKHGKVGDMEGLGITESLSVKRQVLVSASEAAEMILRVDDIIKAAPRKRQADHHPC